MKNTPQTPSTPSPATRAGILALLKADTGMTAAHRARVLAALDGVEEAPEGWLPRKVVADQLGIQLSRVNRLSNEGKIQSRHVGKRLALVDPKEVAAYVAKHPTWRRKPKA